MAAASATMSCTIFCAGSIVLTPPTHCPARLLMASKAPCLLNLSSALLRRSCCSGTIPWSHISRTLSGVASQLLTQSFGISRSG
eukprot:CAMPEP_0204081022 /NCGR_PEP_ID=MMETSP0360-20130528/174851_1 /ASSEMBLY_ACC=CAM_ASM_000342 /TAXON_ID=268821 /ORGANISM="Scrippsiella Hangoei, Strain SHTV-5" /LENGTH=83 /DNA_ID=CAMNT_0051029831 /DNA_START=44 /DNA_END=292 /DNA_ORIENTATION=+